MSGHREELNSLAYPLVTPEYGKKPGLGHAWEVMGIPGGGFMVMSVGTVLSMRPGSKRPSQWTLGLMNSLQILGRKYWILESQRLVFESSTYVLYCLQSGLIQITHPISTEVRLK